MPLHSLQHPHNWTTEKSSEANRSNLRSWFKPIKDNSQNIGSLIEAISTKREYGAGFTLAISALLSNLVLSNALQKKLICIDDLERRPGKFSLDELLGFIENLAEEKECKVILIYNESKIVEDPQASNTLKEYREKVIDYEIKLDPDSVENFHIGFGNTDPDEDIVLNYLSKENIQVNNIRVFKKLKWNLDKFRPHIADFSPRVRERIINEIIFISLSKLDNNFPVNLDELVSLGDFSKLLSEREEEGRDIYLLAINLGYTNSEISSEIICLVETSFCDYQRFCGEGKRLNDREIQHEIREKLHEAYRPYLESFESVEDDLQKNLTEFLDKYCKYLDFQELQGLKSISEAIDININSYVDTWIKHQINCSDKLDDLYRLKETLQDNHAYDNKELITELESKISDFEKDISIDAILVRTLTEKRWSRKDVSFLDARTPTQWEQWLLERHPDKGFMVRQGLSMEEEFSETLREVIIELAKKSKLNAMRAEKICRIDLLHKS